MKGWLNKKVCTGYEFDQPRQRDVGPKVDARGQTAREVNCRMVHFAQPRVPPDDDQPVWHPIGDRLEGAQQAKEVLVRLDDSNEHQVRRVGARDVVAGSPRGVDT